MSYDVSTTYVRGFKKRADSRNYFDPTGYKGKYFYAELISEFNRQLILVHSAYRTGNNMWFIVDQKNGIITLKEEPVHEITDASLMITTYCSGQFEEHNFVSLKYVVKVLKDFDICDLKTSEQQLSIAGFLEGCSLISNRVVELKMHEDGLFHAITDSGSEYVILSWIENPRESEYWEIRQK